MMLTKSEKCLHYETCRESKRTMCGRRWTVTGCLVDTPISNEDYLRAASSKGLAEALAAARTCKTCLARKHCEERATVEVSCVEILLEWLKQPKECGDGT